MTKPLLDRWLEAVVATPGLTAIGEVADARRFLVDDALRALQIVRATDGPIVDAGSGGGSPGLPLAVALPKRRITLLDSARKKCEFLSAFAQELANVDVVWGRAEDQKPETYAVALAKALAKPPVAAELTLPLVREGGAVVLWTGPSADLAAMAKVAEFLAGRVESEEDGLVVLRKIGPTPRGFPRKRGLAKKRPLVR